MQRSNFRSVARLAFGLFLTTAACKSTSETPQDAAPRPGCPAVADDLISDFASDAGLYQADGRRGGWYVYGDTVGTLDPPNTSPYPIDMAVGNPNCSGKGSLRVKGTGFAEWGAATGTDFKPRETIDGGTLSVKGVYDASKYRGISFWAKAAAPVKYVMVKFLDPYTDRDSPLPMDDWCVYTAGSAYNCSPYVVKFGDMPPPDAGATRFPGYVNAQIDTTWKRFEVLFVDTRQDPGNPGLKSPGDVLQVSQLMGMAIQVNADYNTDPPNVLANDFEIWIDDVAFIK